MVRDQNQAECHTGDAYTKEHLITYLQSSEFLSPGHRSSRRTTVEAQMIVAQMQVQADRASRYITHVDNANECAGKKLNRAKKTFGDVIALLDDAQERLDTSKKNVEKGHV